jgi:hypothetical protein
MNRGKVVFVSKISFFLSALTFVPLFIVLGAVFWMSGTGEFVSPRTVGGLLMAWFILFLGIFFIGINASPVMED